MSKQDGRHLLGVHDGRLYVGGTKVIRCYQVSGGKLLWESKTAEAFGRPALTPNAIYVPQNSSIIQLDLLTGQIVATAAVQSSDADEPVGNLFTNGQHLLVYGIKRVYALGQPEVTLP